MEIGISAAKGSPLPVSISPFDPDIGAPLEFFVCLITVQTLFVIIFLAINSYS